MMLPTTKEPTMFTAYRLTDATTIRPATRAEYDASIFAAAHDGGAGAVEIDGVSAYVTADDTITYHYSSDDGAGSVSAVDERDAARQIAMAHTLTRRDADSFETLADLANAFEAADGWIEVT